MKLWMKIRKNYDFVIGHWSHYRQMVHLKYVSFVAVNVVVGFFRMPIKIDDKYFEGIRLIHNFYIFDVILFIWR